MRTEIKFPCGLDIYFVSGFWGGGNFDFDFEMGCPIHGKKCCGGKK